MNAHAASRPAPRPEPLAARVFSAAFGAFLGLTLLKFGNPPIMEKHVSMPGNIYEWIMGFPWPITIAYALLLGVAALGLWLRANLPSSNTPASPKAPSRDPVVMLLLAWLGWVVISAFAPADPALAAPTVRHLAAAVLCFFLGRSFLARSEHLGLFWGGLLVAFGIVLAVGWEQHFGGLQQTRDYFYAYIYPTMPEVPPEYLKKISSNRIFSTLFYPNTLAGAVLLLLPVLSTVVWRLGGGGRMTPAARGFLVALLVAGALGCLIWSGSKGGWLLLLGMLLLAGWVVLPVSRGLKLTVLLAVVVVGLAGFFYKYAGFFRKGATSVVARFDYWQAAAHTAAQNPLVGRGPGSFAIAYQAVKRPEAEMSRLVHNDYLQQASDSGAPAFALYLGFVGLALVFAFRKVAGPAREVMARWDFDSRAWLAFSVWLGVAAWAAQSLIEFGLYIPALAWPAFTFLGWLNSPSRR